MAVSLTAQVNLQLSQQSLRAVQSQVRSGLQQTQPILRFDPGTQSQLTAMRNHLREVSAGLGQAEKSARAFGEQVALGARRFAAFSLGAGTIFKLVGAFKAAVVAAAVEYERQFVKLVQLEGRFSSDVAAVNQEITRLATSYGVASKQILGWAITLKQAGLAADEVKTSLETLSKASLAPSFGNMENAVEGFVAIRQQFKITANDMEKAFGSINAVAGGFAVEAENITTAIQKAGGSFASLGGDLNQFIALFTSVRQTTRESADEIASGLRTIFTRLQRADTVEDLKALRVELRYTAQEAAALGDINLEGKFVGVYESISRISEKLKELDPRDQRYADIVERLGGTRQVSRILPLLQQFSQAQKAYNVALAGQNSLGQSTSLAQETLANKLARVKEEYLGVVRAFTQTSAFRMTADVFLKMASSVAKVIEFLGPLAPILATFAATKIFSGIGQFVGGFGNRILSSQTTSSVNMPRRYAEGGLVPGVGDAHSQIGVLQPGEYVLDKKTTQRLGAHNIKRLQGMSRGGLSPTEYKRLLADTRQTLTPEQLDAVHQYTIGSGGLNYSLRNPHPAGLLKKYQKRQQLLDSAMRPLGKDLNLYRGLDAYGLLGAGLAGGVKPGMVVTDPGFLSTSIKRRVGEEFAGPQGMLFDIRAGKDKSGLPIPNSAFPGQQEFVLPRNSQLLIQAILAGKKGQPATAMAELLAGGGRVGMTTGGTSPLSFSVEYSDLLGADAKNRARAALPASAIRLALIGLQKRFGTPLSLLANKLEIHHDEKGVIPGVVGYRGYFQGDAQQPVVGLNSAAALPHHLPGTLAHEFGHGMDFLFGDRQGFFSKEHDSPANELALQSLQAEKELERLGLTTPHHNQKYFTNPKEAFARLIQRMHTGSDLTNAPGNDILRQSRLRGFDRIEAMLRRVYPQAQVHRTWQEKALGLALGGRVGMVQGGVTNLNTGRVRMFDEGGMEHDSEGRRETMRDIRNVYGNLRMPITPFLQETVTRSNYNGQLAYIRDPSNISGRSITRLVDDVTLNVPKFYGRLAAFANNQLDVLSGNGWLGSLTPGHPLHQLALDQPLGQRRKFRLPPAIQSMYTSNPTLRGLYKSHILNPGDKTLHLVMSDALEEAGHDHLAHLHRGLANWTDLLPGSMLRAADLRSNFLRTGGRGFPEASLRVQAMRRFIDDDALDEYLERSGYDRSTGLLRASGGLVPGVGNTDSVPVDLPPDSYVIRQSSVRKMGAASLAKLVKRASGRVVKTLPNDEDIRRLLAMLPTNRLVDTPNLNTLSSGRQPIYTSTKKHPHAHVARRLLPPEAIGDMIGGLESKFGVPFNQFVEKLKVTHDPQGGYLGTYQPYLYMNRPPTGAITLNSGTLWDDRKRASSTLAHEFGHAVDWHVGSKKSGYFNFATQGWSPKIKAMAYKYLQQELLAEDEGRLDKHHNRAYFESDVESFARLIQRMHDKEDIYDPQLRSGRTGSLRKLEGELRKVFPPAKVYRSPLEKTLGLAEGGAVAGLVPGVGATDSVPVDLPPESFVIRKSSVQKIGVENLEKLAKYARGGSVVPAITMPGEWIYSPEQAKRIGVNNLHQMNLFGRLPMAHGGRVKMAGAGTVGDSDPTPNMLGVPNELLNKQSTTLGQMLAQLGVSLQEFASVMQGLSTSGKVLQTAMENVLRKYEQEATAKGASLPEAKQAALRGLQSEEGQAQLRGELQSGLASAGAPTTPTMVARAARVATAAGVAQASLEQQAAGMAPTGTPPAQVNQQAMSALTSMGQAAGELARLTPLIANLRTALEAQQKIAQRAQVDIEEGQQTGNAAQVNAGQQQLQAAANQIGDLAPRLGMMLDQQQQAEVGSAVSAQTDALGTQGLASYPMAASAATGAAPPRTGMDTLGGVIQSRLQAEIRKRGGRVSQESQQQLSAKVEREVAAEYTQARARQLLAQDSSLRVDEAYGLAQDQYKEDRLSGKKIAVGDKNHVMGYFSGQKRSILGVADVGKGVGFWKEQALRARDSLTNMKNLLRDPVAVQNALSMAGSWGGSKLDQMYNVETVAKTPGQVAGYKTTQAISGALTGASVGASMGAIGGPYLMAIGAAAGATYGLVSSLIEADKRIREAKIGIAIQELGKVFNSLAQGSRMLDATSREQIGKNLDTLQKEGDEKVNQDTRSIWRKLYTSTPYDTEEYLANRKRQNQETFSGLGPQFAQAIQGSMESTIRANPDGGVKEMQERFFADQTNSKGEITGRSLTNRLIDILASLEGVDSDVVSKRYQKTFTTIASEENTRRRQQIGVSATAETVNPMETLARSVEAAVLAFERLQIPLKSLGDLLEGQITATTLINRSEGVSMIGSFNRGRYREDLSAVLSPFGEVAKPIFQTGDNLDQMQSFLPVALAQVMAGQRAGDQVWEPGRDLSTRLRAQFGNTDGMSEIIRVISGQINATNLPDMLRESGFDTGKLTQKLLEPVMGPFKDNIAKIASGWDKANAGYLEGLATYSQRGQRVGGEEDRISELQLEAQQNAARWQGVRQGTPGIKDRLITLDQLLQPFNARQSRLAGDIGGDPQAIATRLREKQQQVMQGEETLRQQAGQRGESQEGEERFRQTAEAVTKLKTEASNLQQALKNLADASTQLSAVQTKLGQLQTDRESRLSFGERFLTAGPEERDKMNEGLMLIFKAAKQNYKIENFTDEQRSNYFSTLGSLGQAKITPLGLRASDIRQKSLEASFGGVVQLDKKSKEEEKSLEGKMAQIMEDRVKAQQLLVDNQKGLQDEFFTQLGRAQDGFLKELKAEMLAMTAAIRATTYGRAASELGEFQGRVGGVNLLKGLGVTSREEIGKFDANFDQVSQFVVLERQRQKMDSLLKDPDKLKRLDRLGEDFAPDRFGDVKLYDSLINKDIYDESSNFRERVQQYFKDIGLNKDQSDQAFKKVTEVIKNRDQYVKGGDPNAEFTHVDKDTTTLIRAGLESYVRDEWGRLYREQTDVRTGLQDRVGPDLEKKWTEGAADLAKRGEYKEEELRKALTYLKTSGQDLETFFANLQKSQDSFKALTEAAYNAAVALQGLRPRQATSEEMFGAAGGGAFGFAGGGMVPGTNCYSSGGSVDNIPARLTAGEFVVRKRQAQANANLLKYINDANGPVQLFYEGGPVQRLGNRSARTADANLALLLATASGLEVATDLPDSLDLPWTDDFGQVSVRSQYLETWKALRERLSQPTSRALGLMSDDSLGNFLDRYVGEINAYRNAQQAYLNYRPDTPKGMGKGSNPAEGGFNHSELAGSGKAGGGGGGRAKGGPGPLGPLGVGKTNWNSYFDPLTNAQTGVAFPWGGGGATAEGWYVPLFGGKGWSTNEAFHSVQAVAKERGRWGWGKAAAGKGRRGGGFREGNLPVNAALAFANPYGDLAGQMAYANYQSQLFNLAAMRPLMMSGRQRPGQENFGQMNNQQLEMVYGLNQPRVAQQDWYRRQELAAQRRRGAIPGRGGLAHFAEGGLVPPSDDTLAWVGSGEYIFDKRSTQRIGAQNLAKIQHFAQGGLVGNAANSPVGGMSVSLMIPPEARQAMDGLVEAMKKLAEPVGEFARAVSEWRGGISQFSGAVNKMCDAIGGIPSRIELDGRQQVTVTITGADLTGLNPEALKQVGGMIADGVRDALRKQIPDL